MNHLQKNTVQLDNFKQGKELQEFSSIPKSLAVMPEHLKSAIYILHFFAHKPIYHGMATFWTA